MKQNRPVKTHAHDLRTSVPGEVPKMTDSNEKTLLTESSSYTTERSRKALHVKEKRTEERYSLAYL